MTRQLQQENSKRGELSIRQHHTKSTSSSPVPASILLRSPGWSGGPNLASPRRPATARACGYRLVTRDRDLLALGELWAAGGTPNAVFRLTADELVAMTQGEVADIAKR